MKMLVREIEIVLPIDGKHIVFSLADMIADAALHGLADLRP